MAKNVTLINQDSQVILSNGLVQLTISKPQGLLTGIKYGGMDNLLDVKSKESDRGYWDHNWNVPGGQDRYQLLRGVSYSVVSWNKNHAEVSFKSVYDPSVPGITMPLSIDFRSFMKSLDYCHIWKYLKSIYSTGHLTNIQKKLVPPLSKYILRSGVSGFYCYAIYERDQGFPAFDLVQTRLVFKLRRERFHYMAITNEKQRVMPMPEDLLPGRGKQLIVPESVLLVNPINPDLKGEVDDKYQYSMDNKDSGVHGWISSSPIIGFWMIFPSQEFRNGGPTKQNLTAHTGPLCLAMFHSSHYIGNDMLTQFQEGETWRKVLGPVFVYLNTTSDASKAHNLWSDAKKQRIFEKSVWPYDFLSTPYYVEAKERGSASGVLLVQDRFISSSLIPAKNAYIGLSAATTEGSWQTESKDYQFWVQTDLRGNFNMKNAIPGEELQLGNLVYSPPRDGPTIWEIGFADRTASDFFVPDVNPMYVNKLFLNSPEKYRQYGLWDRYTDLHPDSDQIFTVGDNTPKKDWFFAHVDRKGPTSYLSTTWEVRFNLNQVTKGAYTLRLAIASATRSDLKVHVNNISNNHLVFQVYNLGTDNSICRHGIHGLYRLFNIEISSSLLVEGDNCLYPSQERGGDSLCGILYDYLRLEGPNK